MLNKSSIIELADIFVKCATSTIDTTEVLNYINKIDGLCDGPKLKAAVHYLYHYIIDEDIRRVDASYDQAQKAKLLAYADEIRREEAGKIGPVNNFV